VAKACAFSKSIPRTRPRRPRCARRWCWRRPIPLRQRSLRDHVKDHSQDAELAARLKEKEKEAKLAQMNTGMGRTPAERAAFAALDAHRLDEAQERFTAILNEEPANGRAAAGMGFLRIEQKNLADAVNYLTRAEASGFKERAVEGCAGGFALLVDDGPGDAGRPTRISSMRAARSSARRLSFVRARRRR